MYNYFEYNDCRVNDLAKVHIISKQILPAKSISTIKIQSRDGELYNGSSYEPLSIEISLYVEGTDSVDYESKLSSLRDIFSTKEIVKVSFSPNTFMMGIMSGEFFLNEKTKLSSYGTIQIICYSPICYSSELELFSNDEDATNRVVETTNNGGLNALPFISIGFTKDAHYAQIEHMTTGERILVGEYPKLNLVNVPDSLRIHNDNCESLQQWVNSAPNIDSDRTSGGNFSITASGAGICLATLPSSGTTTWQGGCYRTSLATEVDEFRVEANINHNSSGKNGDPTIPNVNTDTETIVSGGKTTVYEVTASSLNVRKGPGTTYAKRGSLKKGYKITKYTLTKGWIKFTYNGADGYVKASYCKTKTVNNEVKTTVKNLVIASNSDIAENVNLRATPTPKGKLVSTIPIGTVVRVITSKAYHFEEKDSKGKVIKEGDYYKLHTKYKGNSGYINVANLRDVKDVTIEYDYSDDVKIADDKTGVLELYGFDVNGTKLFKVKLIDEQSYFEYTKPVIEIGSKIVAQDKTNVPAPESRTNDEDGNIKTTTYLSGRLGNWNEFGGKVVIERKKIGTQYLWNVTLQKKKDGVVTNVMSAHNLKSPSFPTGKLSYFALYMGTQSTSMNKCCNMSLSDLKVYNTNNKGDAAEISKIYFHEGDILDIDFDNRDVYINEVQRNDLLDIGSRFFSIQGGEDKVKINSDDENSIMSVVFRNQWLGSIK